MTFCKSILKQIIVMISLVIVPYFWVLSFDNISVVDTYSNCYILVSIGLLMILESWLYVNLPIDLIPNFIPIIGNLDNGFAYIFMLFGFYAVLFGLFINYIEDIKYYLNF